MTRKHALTNGLTFLYLHTPQDPIAACHLFLPLGAALENPEQAGISTLMWALFQKGTTTRSARQIAEEIESIGAFLGAGPTYDFAEVSCHATSDQIFKSLSILQDALLNPTFPEQEIQKERAAHLASIQAKKENIFTVTNELLNAHLYPDHPYGRPPSGLAKTVARLTQKDLFAWHEKVVSPVGSVFSMASDIPFEEALPQIEKLLGSRVWSGYKRALSAVGGASSAPTAVQEIKNPSPFEQSYLMIGFPAAPVISEDYISLKVLNTILGGGMSARLFHHLREKQGLAYDVGSFYASRQQGSGLVIHMGLQHDRMQEAKFGIFEQLKNLQKDGIPPDELQQVKNQLKGTFILDQQTNSQRAHYRGWWEILGLGINYDVTFMTHVDSLSPVELQQMAVKYFDQPHVSVETIPTTNGA